MTDQLERLLELVEQESEDESPEWEQENLLPTFWQGWGGGREQQDRAGGQAPEKDRLTGEKTIMGLERMSAPDEESGTGWGENRAGKDRPSLGTEESRGGFFGLRGRRIKFLWRVESGRGGKVGCRNGGAIGSVHSGGRRSQLSSPLALTNRKLIGNMWKIWTYGRTGENYLNWEWPAWRRLKGCGTP